MKIKMEDESFFRILLSLQLWTKVHSQPGYCVWYLLVFHSRAVTPSFLNQKAPTANSGISTILTSTFIKMLMDNAIFLTDNQLQSLWGSQRLKQIFWWNSCHLPFTFFSISEPSCMSTSHRPFRNVLWTLTGCQGRTTPLSLIISLCFLLSIFS